MKGNSPVSSWKGVPKRQAGFILNVPHARGSVSLLLISSTLTEFIRVCVCTYILYVYTHTRNKNSSPNTLNEIHNLNTFNINSMYRANEGVTIIILAVQLVYTVSKINLSCKTIVGYFYIPPVNLVNQIDKT